MRKVELMHNGELVVHYDGVSAAGTALCGNDLCGDSFGNDEWSEGMPSTRRVNCRQCIKVRDYVRGIITYLVKE